MIKQWGKIERKGLETLNQLSTCAQLGPRTLWIKDSTGHLYQHCGYYHYSPSNPKYGEHYIILHTLKLTPPYIEIKKLISWETLLTEYTFIGE